MKNKHTLKLLSIFLLSWVLLSDCKKEELPEEEEEEEVSHVLTEIAEQQDPNQIHFISEQVRGRLQIELFPEDALLSEEELNEESARLNSIWMSWASRLQNSVIESGGISWNADGIPTFSVQTELKEDFNRFISAMREQST